MRQGKSDLVLLDVVMCTVLDGLSASCEMRADPDNMEAPCGPSTAALTASCGLSLLLTAKEKETEL